MDSSRFVFDLEEALAAPKVEKRVKLTTKSFIPDPKPLNVDDLRELRSLVGITLDEFTRGSIAPPADPNSYYELRGVPFEWSWCAAKVSKRHLFVHAFVLASADKRMKEYAELHKKALDVASGHKDAGRLVQLLNRPPFFLSGLPMAPGRYKLNAWSWEMKGRMGGFASKHGMSTRAIVLAYTTLSLLTVPEKLDGWDDLLRRDIWQKWDEHLDAEVAGVTRLFESL